MLLLLALLLQQPAEPPVGFPGHSPSEAFGVQGNRLFAQKRFAEALAHYREGEEKDARTGCGTCNQQVRGEYRLAQAVTLEHLGRYDEAVAAYLRCAGGMIYAHLADLYEAAGQLEDLEAFAGQMDDRLLQAHQGDRTYLQYSPSRELRRLFEIRGWEKSGKWADLVGRLKIFSFPRQAATRRCDWEAMEAVRILARHPADAVPRLLEAYQAQEPGRFGWIPYALGRCGTPEAIAAILAVVRKDNDWESLHGGVYALAQAGDPGTAALRSLADGASAQLKDTLDDWSAGKLGEAGRETPFPPIPKTLRLPAKLPR